MTTLLLLSLGLATLSMVAADIRREIARKARWQRDLEQAFNDNVGGR